MKSAIVLYQEVQDDERAELERKAKARLKELHELAECAKKTAMDASVRRAAAEDKLAKAKEASLEDLAKEYDAKHVYQAFSGTMFGTSYRQILKPFTYVSTEADPLPLDP